MKIFKITAMEQLKRLWNMLTYDRDYWEFNDSYLYDYCTGFSDKFFKQAESVYKDMLNEDGSFFINPSDGTYISWDSYRIYKSNFEIVSVDTERYRL